MDDPCPDCGGMHPVYDYDLVQPYTDDAKAHELLFEIEPLSAATWAYGISMAKSASAISLAALLCEVDATNELDYSDRSYLAVPLLKSALLSFGIFCRSHKEFAPYYAKWQEISMAAHDQGWFTDSEDVATAVHGYLAWAKARHVGSLNPYEPIAYIESNPTPWKN